MMNSYEEIESAKYGGQDRRKMANLLPQNKENFTVVNVNTVEPRGAEESGPSVSRLRHSSAADNGTSFGQ